MPYNGYQTYLTWGGSIGSSPSAEEIWQCGLHLADPAATLVPALPTVAQLTTLYNGALKTYHQNANTFINPGAVLKWIKAAPLGLDGDYTSDPVLYEGTAWPGGAVGTDTGAPQVSVAVTLWSGSQFGAANYGRYYLPWVMTPTDPVDGQMQVANAGYMATTSQVYLNAVNVWAAGWNALPLDPKICNMSRTGTGTTKRVASVRVGSIKDTQRRRRNRLNETYATLTIT